MLYNYMYFKKTKDVNPDQWGPNYWFVLHCTAYNYPEYPNAITKRKYYDFIQNIPLFLPNQTFGENFSVLLDKYPVSPYLDNRDSFVRWVNFIHNKVNVSLGKAEISLYTSLDIYHEKMANTTVAKEMYFSLNNDNKKRIFYALQLFIWIWFIYTWI
jgi:hypothetical protein